MTHSAELGLTGSTERAGRLLALLPLVAMVWGLAPGRPVSAADARVASAVITSVVVRAEAPASAIAPTNTGLTSVRAGHPIRIILYQRLAGVTAPVQVQVGLTVSHGTPLVISRGSFTVGRSSLGGGSAGWRWYWNIVKPCSSTANVNRHGQSAPECLPQSPGTYTLSGFARLGGRQYTSRTTFSVSS